MRRRVLGIGFGVAVAAGVGIAAWRTTHRHRGPERLVLQGNIDLRQVDLPFE